MTNTETNLVLSIQDDFLSMAEAANELAITASALRKWLTKNVKLPTPSFIKRKHTCTISGITQNMLVISKSMLLMVSKYKGFPTSNQYQRKGAAPFLENQNNNVAMLTLMQEMMQELKAIREERKQLNSPQVKNMVQEAVEDMGTQPITSKMKDELTLLCNNIIFKELGITLGDDYDDEWFSKKISTLRRNMNIELGKKTIKEYTQIDYLKALKYLKQFINWN